MAPKRLSILGVGLLGGSLGLALRKIIKGCEIVGYGHWAATLQEAMKIGAIDSATDSAEAAVRGADLVILCTPVGVFPQILKEIGPALSPGALITDVGSTKRSVVEMADAMLPPAVHFVGSHPMAGSEKRGVRYASADLFQDAVCITTPSHRTNPGALEKIESFWRSLGMSLIRLSPAEHDRRLADISHLPHAIAATLVTLQDDASIPLAGKGFFDTTRVAAGDGGLWRDIFIDNRDNLRDGLRRFRDQLDGLIAKLDTANAEAVKAWLDDASTRRQRMTDRKPARPSHGD